jgi:hypothetical protein
MSSLEQGFSRVAHGLRYAATLLKAMPRPASRQLVREALMLGRRLPAQLDQPLPNALATLTPAPTPQALDPQAIREIVDALTAFGAGRPLGICLRRSLLRYHFLRRAGLPVVVNFGARRLGDALGGHAWLTLNGEPYHEPPENYQRYALMLSFPQDTETAYFTVKR